MTAAPSYQVRVDYHQFLLAPLYGGSPVLDPSTAGPVLAFDPSVPGTVIVRTGCASGPVNVTVRIGHEPVPDLAAAVDGWDVAEQAAILIADDLYLAPLEGIGPAPLVYTLAAPGLHLVQVLARGRAAQYDAVVDEATEDYDITITPVTTDPGRQTTGGDAV